MHEHEGAHPSDSSFKVIDRRRFTAEGGLRPGSESLPDSRIDSRAALEKAAAKKADTQAPTAPARPGPKKQWQSEVDFLGFVASLATNAMAALGMLPEADARGMPHNPAVAREYIEIIAMLQERTEGNVTQEEEQALKRLLSDLRLQYVEATQKVQPVS